MMFFISNAPIVGEAMQSRSDSEVAALRRAATHAFTTLEWLEGLQGEAIEDGQYLEALTNKDSDVNNLILKGIDS